MKRNREQQALRRHEAWDLRIKGRTYREIGAAMGVSHVTAQEWVKTVFEEKSLPLASEVRKQELARLERYLDALDHKIECGDIAAIQTGIRISESIRKLLGVDLPVIANAGVDQAAQTELEIMTLIRQVQARNQTTLERISQGSQAAIEGGAVVEGEIVERS